MIGALVGMAVTAPMTQAIDVMHRSPLISISMESYKYRLKWRIEIPQIGGYELL
jgi:hypothetical protein